MLRPGSNTLEKFGGLQFYELGQTNSNRLRWFPNNVIIKLNKIEKDIGVIFKSHIDGKIVLSPEKSIKIQKSINSDILMVLDECPKLTNDRDKLKKAIDVSTNWAKRSKIEFGNNKKKVYLELFKVDYTKICDLKV